MKQFLFILFLILSNSYTEAGKIVHINCPYMIGPDADNGQGGKVELLQSIIGGDISSYNCIPTIQGQVHFGIEFKAHMSVPGGIQDIVFLKVQFNNQTVETIPFTNFEETEEGGDYFYYYLFDHQPPSIQIVQNQVPTFELKVELLYEINSDTFIPYPMHILDYFLEYDEEGEAETEFTADIVSCEALELANQKGFLPKSPKLINKNEIRIMPNPFNDYININLQEIESDYICVEIFDLTGKSVLKEIEAFSEQKIINTKNLLPGVYTCKFNTDNFEKNIKILKSK